MAQIKLGNSGLKALIDDADLPLVAQYSWSIHYKDNKNKKYFNVSSSIKNPITGHYQRIRLQRFLLNPPKGLQVDHINHNRLDNRRQNLRICTNQQNNFNRRKVEKSSSSYKGVYLRGKKYIASIYFNGKSIYLGCFDSDVEAAKVYDAKARELFGEFACVNFPEKVPILSC